jgi:hypothetical protein
MVLNLIIRKVLPFIPGRDWTKKGLPKLVRDNINIIVIIIGDKIISPINAKTKSITGFI